MKYGLKNNIRVFYDRWGGESSTGIDGISNKVENKNLTEDERKTLEGVAKGIIDSLSRDDQKEALKRLDSWKGTFSATNKPQQYQDMLLTLEGLLRYSPGFSQKATGDKLKSLQDTLNTFLKGIKTETIPQITKDKDRSNENLDKFKKKYGNIKEFGDNLLKFAIEHPVIVRSDIASKNPLIQAKEDIKGIGADKLNGYNAIIESLMTLVQSKTFERNTGITDRVFSNDEKKMRMKLFESAVKEMILKAGVTGKVQNLDDFKNGDFREKSGGIALEDQKVLTARPIDTLYDYFLVAIKGKTLDKTQILAYIKGLSIPIIPIIEKLPKDNPIRKSYEEKFASMRAIAESSILYDSWSQLASIFNGNTLDKLIHTLEESKTKNGAIGYDSSGNFAVYSPKELSEEIMKDGKIEGTTDTAWNNYIKSTGGDIVKMREIFGEEGIFALYMYSENNSNPTFGDGEAKILLDNLKAYYQDGSHIDSDLYFGSNRTQKTNEIPKWMEKMNIEDDFRNLQLYMNEQNIELNKIEELPKKNGSIDGVRLIFDLIRNRDISPRQIEGIKQALEKDFSAKTENYKRQRKEAIEEIKVKYKTWGSALEEVGISTKLGKTDISAENLEHNLSIEDIGELEKRIQAKREDKNITDEQRQTLKGLLGIIQSQKGRDTTEVAAKQLSITSSPDIAKSSGDQGREKMLTNTTLKAAEADTRRKNIEENRNAVATNPDIISLYTKYNIPQDTRELSKPKYLNRIQTIIRELEQKPNKTPTENIFLNQLYDVASLIKLDAEAVSAVQEMRRHYPEFSETAGLIQQNTVVFKDITTQEIAQYQYLQTPYPLSDSGRFILQQEIGGEGKKLTEAYKGKDISEYIGNATIRRTGYTECEVSFPDSQSGRNIGSVSNIPLGGIDAFIAQSEIYNKLGLPSLIPLLPEINKAISRKTGKNTDYTDGKLDIEEVKRTISTIAELLGINVTGDESVEGLSKKIQSKYEYSSVKIEQEFINLGILKVEGGYSNSRLNELLGSSSSDNVEIR